MAFDYVQAVDAILGTIKVAWDAGTPALTGGPVPQLVFESLENDLKPHPRDGTLPWARAVVRHADASKITLNNDVGTARYRRIGVAWVQVFVPATSAKEWTLGQQLAMVAQNAYEGKRAGEGKSVVFTKVSIQDRPKDGAFYVFDVKANFYWDQIK